MFMGDDCLETLEFEDFMDKVRKVNNKNDYINLYFHPLLKHKRGQIEFLTYYFDWLRGLYCIQFFMQTFFK